LSPLPLLKDGRMTNSSEEWAEALNFSWIFTIYLLK